MVALPDVDAVASPVRVALSDALKDELIDVDMDVDDDAETATEGLADQESEPDNDTVLVCRFVFVLGFEFVSEKL